MKYILLKLILSLLTTSILTGCQSPPNTPIRTSVPTRTNPTLITIIPSTPTKIPSSTITPTKKTSTPTISDAGPDLTLDIGLAYPTRTSTPTIPVATENARKTLALIPQPCEGALKKELSPYGPWAAVACAGGGLEYSSYTYVIRTDTKVISWKLGYTEFHGKKYGHLEGFLNPFYWSLDGKFFYLTTHPQFDGDLEFSNGTGLLRLDLQTGRVNETLSEGTKNLRFAISFSPSNAFLAYFNHSEQPITLHLLRLYTGEEQKILFDSDYSVAGDFLWSPDNKLLIFGMGLGNYREERTYTLNMVNLNDLSTTLLIPESNERYSPIAWIDDSRILLENLTTDTLWDIDIRAIELKAHEGVYP